MKLLRLKITDPAGFRSLQPGFEIHFLREWNYDEAGDFNPYILAGPNGSGKSNVLEVLAAIFYHIECVYLNYRPEIFEYDETENPQGFRSEKSSPDGFEIEYLISAPASLKMPDDSNYRHIKISKKPGISPVITMVKEDFFNEQSEDKTLSGIEARKVLPDFVIGYSSGENEILSLPFFKMRFIHFDEYKDYLIKELPYLSVPEGRLTFLNSEFNQAIVLSNLLMQDKELLKLFKDDVGIDDIRTFRIVIKKHIILDKNHFTEDPLDTTKFPEAIAEITENESGEKCYRLDITQNLKKTIEKLKNCSTCSYEDNETGEIYFDYWVNEETKKAFALNFSSPVELFQTFQILLTLNLYKVNDKTKKELYQSPSLYINETVPSLPPDERIMCFKDFWIKKTGVKENILIKSLSDGEHQLLHSLGMCLLYKDKECLFLLDEPETHFNPDWRAGFISCLRKCFKGETAQSTIREMLITTHTPFLISDSKKEYVMVFNKNIENKTIEVCRPDYNTFGASINKITMKTFGKMETISGYAEQKLRDIMKRFEAGEAGQELMDEANNLLGDSVEKILFINRILDSMEKK